MTFRQISRFQSCLSLLERLNNSVGCHAITLYAAINSKIISPSYRLHTLSIWAWDRQIHGSSGRALGLFYAAEGSQLLCWSWPQTPLCHCNCRGCRRQAVRTGWQLPPPFCYSAFCLTVHACFRLEFYHMVAQNYNRYSSILSAIPVFCCPCSLASRTVLPPSPNAVAYLLSIPVPLMY